MTVVNSGLILKGARSEFFDSFKQRDAAALYQLLATRIPSTTDQEKYRWLGAVPTMREWGTGRLAKGLNSESYDVANLTYEATVQVDRDELDDDQTGQISTRVRLLGEAAATHKDFMLAALLNSGATTGYVSYDGVTFFNAAHVSGQSGSQSNLASQTVGDVSDITVAEFKKGLKAAFAQMMGLKDDRGNSAMIQPNGFVVVVPPALYFTALEAVSATLLNNTTNVLAGAAKVMALGDLSGSVNTYVCKTDGVLRPFIFQDRMPIEFNALSGGSELEFQKGYHQYGVRARYRITYGEWRFCVKLTFSV